LWWSLRNISNNAVLDIFTDIITDVHCSDGGDLMSLNSKCNASYKLPRSTTWVFLTILISGMLSDYS
jgi:hypothetical protein